jgi:hypothetical protein
LNIKYLKHSEIDKQKWDDAITISENRLVYALSWYLDIVSPNWEALIVGDYDIVMPLTIRKKLGLKYIIQPPFTQQLGIFHQSDIKVDTDSFLDKIPSCFKYVNINLNSGNSKGFKYHYLKRLNYELDLDNSYENIHSGSNTNTKRNIKKSLQNDLKNGIEIKSEELIDFKKKHAVEKISDKHYDILKQLCLYTEMIGVGRSESVVGVDDSNAVSAAFLIEKFDRLIYLISASSIKGKEKSSNFFLINALIQKNSLKKITLDFEGGIISGLSRFFKGFGAFEKEYYNVIINRLPWPLKYFKR